MRSKIRIPTILGLGILVVGMVVGIFLTTQKQSALFKTRAGVSAIPKNITIANVSNTSVSIYWQTDEEAPGFIQAGPSNTLGSTFKDDRDLGGPQNHRFHFVTLSNLTPNTTYYYKVNSGSSSYPSGNPSTFKTADTSTASNLQPLVGTILDASMNPISEALVVLSIPGAQSLAAITKVSGSFILPLKDIRDADLSQIEIPASGTSAALNIIGFQARSRINLQLPPDNNVLPPLILGQDLDLVPTPASPSASISKYDLNDDGVTNSLDLSIVLKNFGKNPKNKKADLNGDKVVDQKDVDILNKFIPRISPR